MSPQFIDTRLHLSVRPFLEYAIPDTSQVVLRALLGDVPSSEAQEALRRLLDHNALRCDAVDPVEIPELSSDCMRVMNFTIDYVRQIERDWMEFLKRTANGLRIEVRTLKRTTADVTAVFHRYRDVNKEVSEREYRTELTRLHRRMEDMLTLFRDAVQPRTERSSELVDSIQRLRESFSAAYGREETIQLMKLRQYFEHELMRMQRDIVTSFVEGCMRLL